MKKLKLTGGDIPNVLLQIPSPPRELYILGGNLNEFLERPRVAIIGSRKVTPYGRIVTEQISSQLAQRGVVIISGLALGIDGIAHQAALDVGGLTIAVLPCGLDEICPRTHYHLAQNILAKGGALISEYPDRTIPHKVNFIARNRIVAGLADAVLITEATEKSGTLHTANFALGQGKQVFAVPGNITSPLSVGTNRLIKTGAMPVTEADDILSSLGVDVDKQSALIIADNPKEQAIINLLQQGMSDGYDLLQSSKLSPSIFSQTLTMLEITGRIRPLGNNHWCLY
jgi:DNA processing protein